MKTKDKILRKALELFNSDGYNIVTTRYIAKELDISAGNLHYHFKHSREIISSLLLELIDKTEILMNSFKNENILTILGLREYLRAVFNLFFEYRFLFISYIDVFRDVPPLRDVFMKVYEKRENQFFEIVKIFQRIEIFKHDVPMKLIKSVISQVFVIADCYIIHNQMTKRNSQDEAINHYLQITLDLFLPLLVAEHEQEYIEKYLLQS